MMVAIVHSLVFSVFHWTGPGNRWMSDT